MTTNNSIHNHIGFTGTRYGMTRFQQMILSQLLKEYYIEYYNVYLHHGDCIGSDAQCHKIALQIGYKIIIHPPLLSNERAYSLHYDQIKEPQEYLKRNHAIVNSSSILIATPKQLKEQLRSGTWATIRYARKANKIIYIIGPDKMIGG